MSHYKLNSSFDKFENQIINQISEENGNYFFIDSIENYISKIKKFGKVISFLDKEKIIAYVLYYDNQETTYITMVFVHESYRSKGLAKKLIQILKILHDKIKLEVNPENYKAVSLYQKLGFKFSSNREMVFER